MYVIKYDLLEESASSPHLQTAGTVSIKRTWNQALFMNFRGYLTAFSVFGSGF